MEFPFLVLPLLALFILSVLTLKITKNSKASKSHLPPGSTGLPLIGESLSYFYSMWKGRPEEFVFHRMSTYSPTVFKTSILGDPMAVLCGAPGCKFLFTGSNKVTKKWMPKSLQLLLPALDTGVTESENVGPVAAFARSDNLRKLVGVVDGVARRCLELQWRGEVVTAYPLVKNYTFAHACLSFLSIEDPGLVNKMAPLLENIGLGMLSLPINLPGTTLNTAIKASKQLNVHIAQIVSMQRSADQSLNSNYDHQHQPRNLLSFFLETSLNDMDIASRITGSFVAAEEMNYVIPVMLKYLAHYPDIYHKVYQENMEIQANKAPGELLNWEDIQKLRYTWNVACEVMRIHPPAPAVFRETITDITYAGYHIPKGFKLYASIDSMHKDPKTFPNPGIFDPSRFDGCGPPPYTYMPFGGGINICPGRKYGKLAVLVFIHNAVKKFKWETLEDDEKILANPFPIPAKGLPLLLRPHDQD